MDFVPPVVGLFFREVKTNYLTSKSGGQGVNWIRGNHAVAGRRFSASANSFSPENAALNHNFGYFITGRAVAVPLATGQTFAESISLGFSRWPIQARMLVFGLLTVLMLDLLIIAAPWSQLGAGMLSESDNFATLKILSSQPGIARSATRTARTMASAMVGRTSWNAANINFKPLTGAEGDEAVTLPAIWHGSPTYSWLVQIGELGRIMYEAVPDADGQPLQDSGVMGID